MKRGNSILAEECPRMRSFLSRQIHLPFMHPQILRKSRNFDASDEFERVAEERFAMVVLSG
jgi:hypothetical protein